MINSFETAPHQICTPLSIQFYFMGPEYLVEKIIILKGLVIFLLYLDLVRKCTKRQKYPATKMSIMFSPYSHQNVQIWH